MKTTIMFAGLLFLAGSAFAQLNPQPPLSTVDGVGVNPIGLNSGTTHWENPAGLAAYRYASHADLPSPNMQSPDDILHLNWAGSAPSSLVTLKSSLNSNGGIFRTIFVGESAGWEDDFGYTRSGFAPGPASYTVFQDINAVPPGNNRTFGDFADIPVAGGWANVFDLWFNASSSFSDEHPVPANPGGGYYTFFNPANSDPLLTPGPMLWSTTPLLVNTWDSATGTYIDIPTYLVGLEDWRVDMNADMDFNDFMFAVQVLPTPVPEPSTYGIAAAGALALLIVLRRRRA